MSEQPNSIQLEDVLITEELSRRSPRQPNLHAENQAMRSLAQQLAQGSERMLQHLVDLAVELCDAGTAGVSLVETQPDGEVVFRWAAMAGLLASHVGGCTPHDFSPCGVCLEQGSSVLFAYPERYFTYLQAIDTPLVEGLVLPLIANGQALGTIWIAAHDQQRQFDIEDVRLMTGLADFTATLLRSQQQANQLQMANTALAVEIGKRKLAEDQVLATIENLPGGAVFVVDRDLRYQLASGEALAVAGFEPNDFIGRTIFEVLPPELATRYEPLYRQALAGESFEHEHQFYGRKASLQEPHWYVSRGRPLLAENGDIYAVLSVSYDITNRKKTEAALLASETRFRQVFDNNMVAMGIWTPAGAITDANDALLELIGYTRTDLEAGAIRWTELTPPEYYDRDLQAVAEVKAKGACVPYEKAFIHKDGYRQPILISSGRFDECTGSGIFCAFDLSDRKQAEVTIAADLRDTRLLHNLAMQVSSGNQRQDLFQSILDTAIVLMHSDMGSLQILDQESDALHLQAWRGFHPNAAAFWQTVGANRQSSCSVALHQGERVIVADVETCDFLAGTADLDYFHLCGIKAMQSTPLLSHGGQFVGMISTHWRNCHHPNERELRFLDLLARQVADLIEHQQAQDSLHKSEDKYRALFESMDEAYAVVEVMADDNGVWNDFLFLEVNPAFVKQTGMEYPVGRKATDLLGTPNPRWAEVYGRVAATGEPIRFEESEATLGRVFDLYVFRLGEDGSRRVAVLFTDITDRKQAEATIAADLQDTQLLRELGVRLTSEENIQVLYNEIMAAAITLARADAGSFQCFDFNTNELKLLATQGLSQAIIDRFDRIRISSQTSCGRALVQKERAFVDFDTSEDLDGSSKIHLDAGFLSAQSTPLISRSRRFIGMFSTHWRRHHRPSDRELRFLDLLARQAADLIEQRRAELERRQILEREQAAREEAERANRVKDEFLAILSHELRSPLNPILGWSKLLQTQNLDAQRTQQALSTIERNAKLQTQLIDDLLDVARILQGKLKIEAALVNLAVVIEAALEVVRTAAKTKGVSLQFDLINVCEVNGDEGRLQQVIWNLLSNAIKFTSKGGQVRVRLQTVDNQAQITVMDTGKGIQPEFLPHLFQAFRQEDVSTTRQYGGLGLGLSIVKYLVDAHGGSITAASPGVGQGATFTVKLPLLQEVNTPPTVSVSADVDLAGLKVLAVDDSADTRELLAAVLSAYGAETRVVASGTEALASLATFAPDVLICDIGMPGMDGYTLLKQIRALPDAQRGNVPAIAVTAFVREEDRQRALDSGFQQHVAKPIEPEALASAIAQLASKRH